MTIAVTMSGQLEPPKNHPGGPWFDLIVMKRLVEKYLNMPCDNWDENERKVNAAIESHLRKADKDFVNKV